MNTGQELVLRITGDSTGGQKSVSDLKAALRDARQEVKDLTSAMEENHLQGNAQFQKELDAAKEKVAGLEGQLKSTRPGVQALGDDLARTAPRRRAAHQPHKELSQ